MHFQLSVKMIVIITEKFQVNIFNKINNLVKELSKVEVHRLSEIRATYSGLVSFALPVSSSVQTVSIIFDYRSVDADAGQAGQFQNNNEWWWAFDEIKIEMEGDPLNSVRKSWEIYE